MINNSNYTTEEIALIESVREEFLGRGLTNEQIDTLGRLGIDKARINYPDHKNVRYEAYAIWCVREMLVKAARKIAREETISSGFPALDSIIGGLKPGNLIVIGARPAMGKTAFGLSMAMNVAEQNIPIAWFSPEMSKQQLVNRLIVSICMVTREKIKSGDMSKDDWQQMETAVKKLSDSPFYIDDTAALSISSLQERVYRLVAMHKVSLIVIDYLQLLNAADSQSESRFEELCIILSYLKALARELNIPIVVLSQLNRRVDKNKDSDLSRPLLTDFRELYYPIVENADVVCLLHRPEYYHIYKDAQGNDLRGKALVIVAKNNHGSTGEATLNFFSEYLKFIS